MSVEKRIKALTAIRKRTLAHGVVAARIASELETSFKNKEGRNAQRAAKLAVRARQISTALKEAGSPRV